MPVPAVLATLSAIGKAAAASATTTTAASLAATTAAAKAASAGIGHAATANASSALTPSINAAAAGNGLSAAPGLMGSSGAGFTPSATYSAAMGNPTVGAVPLKPMQPLGLMGNGAGQTSRLSTVMNDPRFKKFSKIASQSLAGGASGGLSGINAPPLQRNQGAPFKPFEFDLANYQYRRPTGY